MDENMVLSIEFMDGTTALRQIIALFTAENGRTYAALLPLTAAGIPEAGAEIEIVRAIPCKGSRGEEDYEIRSIQSAMEYEIAAAAFEKLDLAAQNPAAMAKLQEAEELAAANASGDTSLPSIFLKNEDGTESEWKMVDLFAVNEDLFAAMTPAEVVIDGLRPNIDISLFRAWRTAEDGAEGITVAGIEDDEEFEKAKKVFDSRLTVDF